MAKKNTILVKMESTAGTGYSYVKMKNPRKYPDKLKMRKFDPRAGENGKGAHVDFVEKKMPSSS